MSASLWEGKLWISNYRDDNGILFHNLSKKSHGISKIIKEKKSVEIYGHQYSEKTWHLKLSDCVIYSL